MAMIIKCKMCGGDLNLNEGASTAECEYCGSLQTIPKADNEKKLTLFARANRLRAACEFDKAAGIYEAIVADFPEEPEAYWGLVLCKYGIEYVDDPATGRKIPTCHRSSFDSVMKDPNVEMAQEYADVVARRLYRQEAKQMEELRKGIIEVSANEEPYDVFICYKETDFDGKRTLDSVLAMDIYEELTGKGYRVFFSRVSLEDKLGTEYEPYIFAALNSAKIMLVIGTDYEYFSAVWVKNEWNRFLKLMAQDKSRHLIPCYKGIDAYDMPEEFARLQAQDLDKMGAIQDILRGVQKLLPKQTHSGKEAAAQSVVGSNPTVASYLERISLFLEDGDWSSADQYCEKVLDIDPKNYRAYLGKLMAQLRVKRQEDLKNCKVSFSQNANYAKVIRFCDENTRKMLEEALVCLNERLEREKKEAQLRELERKRQEEEWKRQEEERKRQEEEQKRQEADRKEQERLARIEILAPIREKIRPVQACLSAGGARTVCLETDGTVEAVGWNEYRQCNVSSWRDIVTVSASGSHTVGLKADGSAVAVGFNLTGQCDVSKWKNLVAITTGGWYTVGLKSDGTVVAVGENKCGQCNVSGWNNLVAISAGEAHTVGLKSDGTVVSVGYNEYGPCNVSNWADVLAISAGDYHTVGLKADGTVMAVGSNNYGQCDVSGWRDIVAISAGGSHTVGLKADGTVVVVGSNQSGQCNVSDWADIVAISAGGSHTVGLKSDGKVKAAGLNNHGQCNVHLMKPFTSLDSLDEERTVARRRNAGLCQHCGGELKGFLLKKCASCGKPKDY